MTLTFIDEIVNPEDIDLQSFEGQNVLCPEIWKTENTIYPKVKSALLLIAKDFMKDVEITDIDPIDIVMTGSLANYNWNKEFSDIDLHIIIDTKKISNKKEFVEKYLKILKARWNDEHNITICSFPVELYIQDKNEPHSSSGIFSLLKNEWVKKPSTGNFNYNDFDEIEIRKKAAEYATMIEDLEERYSKARTVEELKIIYTDSKKLFDKIKNSRTKSKSKKGFELSTNNIVFKYLRRYNKLDTLHKIITTTYDMIHSYKPEKAQISI